MNLLSFFNYVFIFNNNLTKVSYQEFLSHVFHEDNKATFNAYKVKSFRSFSIILLLYVHEVIALSSKLNTSTMKIDPAELQIY